MSLRVDIRHKKLRGGRITLDAKTTKKVVRNQRDALLRTLIQQGEFDIIEGIRARVLDIVEVHEASDTRKPERDFIFAEMRAKAAGLANTKLLLGVEVEAFLEEAKGSIEPGTYKHYQNLSQHLLGHFGADFDMATLLTVNASAYLTSPKKTMNGLPWGAGSQRHAHSFASMVWGRVIQNEEERAEQDPDMPARLTRNPWKRARFAKYRSPRVEFLRFEEWRTVIGGVRGRAAAALLAIGCRAGLRFGEVAHLRPDIDVDMERRMIHVRARSGQFAWKPKNPKNGERDVPMSDDLYEILLEHIELGYVGKTFFIAAPEDSGRPISHSLGIKWTREAFAAAGIEYGRRKDALTFHSLRHTFASWLTQAGMHPKKVARLIGDTPEMVLKVYGHLAEDDHDEAVLLLNRMAA